MNTTGDMAAITFALAVLAWLFVDALVEWIL